MRPPVDTINAPSFPDGLAWLNVAPLRIEKQAGRPVLVDFWDICRPESVSLMPHMSRWHREYGPLGLRVISVHSPGHPFAGDPAVVEQAAGELAVEHPVVLDPDFECWKAYDNPGWPARYLFSSGLTLADVHHGAGGVRETEMEIRRQLGLDGDPGADCPPADGDDLLVVPSPPREGNGSGPYAAGEVWGVFTGPGVADVNGEEVPVPRAGATRLVRHPGHCEAVLDLQPRGGLEVVETVFLPGPPA